jgi:hypothetical protein
VIVIQICVTLKQENVETVILIQTVRQVTLVKIQCILEDIA